MKVALVGAGGMGGVHLDVYKALDGVELVAVVDIDAEKARKKAKDESIRVYENIDDMLAVEKVDMVDVCTPTYLHAEHSIKAMDKGIHVLCEKPISLTVDSAREMVQAAKRNGVFFMVAHVIRFWPEYRYLKKVYDEKTFGKLNHVIFSRIGSRPNWSEGSWMLDVQKSGRVPIDLHVHDADYILYLFGKPKSVMSYGIEDGVNISYIDTHYEYDGILVEAEAAWYDVPLPFSMSFRASFERAVLEYKDGRLVVYETGKQPQEIKLEKTAKSSTGINIDSIIGYYYEIEYFVNCIKNNIPPQVTTPEGAVECLEMLYKELESVRTGQKVKL